MESRVPGHTVGRVLDWKEDKKPLNSRAGGGGLRTNRVITEISKSGSRDSPKEPQEGSADSHLLQVP